MVILRGGNIVGGDGRSPCWFSEIGGQTLLWCTANIASAEADGGGRRCFFIFYGRQGRWINGRVMSGLARIGRHLVVRGGESAWCERADMAGGAGVG